jgi:hypothetical protein
VATSAKRNSNRERAIKIPAEAGIKFQCSPPIKRGLTVGIVAAARL